MNRWPTLAEERKEEQDRQARLVERPMTEAERLVAIENMVVHSGVSRDQRDWVRSVLYEMSHHFRAQIDPAPRRALAEARAPKLAGVGP